VMTTTWISRTTAATFQRGLRSCLYPVRIMPR
jgi:hypothetical protein